MNKVNRCHVTVTFDFIFSDKDDLTGDKLNLLVDKIIYAGCDGNKVPVRNIKLDFASLHYDCDKEY